MIIREEEKNQTRKSLRLRDYDYSLPGYYFVTICTYNRDCIFGNIVNAQNQLNQYGYIAETHLEEIPFKYENVELDCFIIMPNHVHFILRLDTVDPVRAIRELPLPHSRKTRKGQPDIAENPVGAIHELPEEPQNPMGSRRQMLLPKIVGYYKMNVSKQIRFLSPDTPVWQRNYHEHVIRNDNELKAHREYIENNPLKWELDKYFVKGNS